MSNHKRCRVNILILYEISHYVYNYNDSVKIIVVDIHLLNSVS